MSKSFTLGFEWNEDMSYEDFIAANKTLYKNGRSWEIYNLIEQRYIQDKYEGK